MANKAENTKINITMSEELLSQIEEFARKTSQTKSGFICQACRKYIDGIRYFAMLEEMQNAFERLGQKYSDDNKIMDELGRMLTALSIMNEAGKKASETS